MPKISVIVPTYNAEKTIDKTLASLCEQSFFDIEIIVIDSGSTDSTPAVCSALAKIDKRIKCIAEKNGGVSSAGNRGIGAATGQFVMFCSCAGIYSQDMCLTLLEKQLTSGADIVMSSRDIYFGSSEVGTGCFFPDMLYSREKIFANIISPLLCSGGCCYVDTAGAYLMKKRIIDENNLSFNTDIKVAQKCLFTVQYLLCCGSAAVIDKPFYCCFSNPFSASKKYVSDLSENNRMLSFFLKSSIEKSGFDISEQILSSLALDSAFSLLANETRNGNEKSIFSKIAFAALAAKPYREDIKKYKPASKTAKLKKSICLSSFLSVCFFLKRRIRTIFGAI